MDGVTDDAIRQVQARLEIWKKALLDLTRRNRLLYFSGSRGARVQIVGPELDVLYRRIVLDERKLSFPTPADETVEEAELAESSHASWSWFEEAPGASTSTEHRARPGDLQIAFDGRWVKHVVDLQKRLYRLRTDAKTMLSEQGINTLHLAVGLLEWRETTSGDDIVRAPLVLVPVELRREKNKPYECHVFEDADVLVNPTLLHKLEHDFGVSLPSLDPYDGFGEEPDLAGFFNSVDALVADRGWQVIRECWLSHFSFQKLVMYEDLSRPGTAEEGAAHGVLSALCEIEGAARFPDDAPTAEILETKFDAPDTYPVVDADGSQIEVLARVSAGESLVVEGPPGTGKSQTIVNLISQALREGKSVLFVSEKKAALDVVYQRLGWAGLADLCLEMHSNKTNKRQVVSELFKALQPGRAATDPNIEEQFEDRKRFRNRLRDYVEELHRPRDARGRSAFVVQGRLARLDAAPLIAAALPFSSARDLASSDDRELLQAVREVGASGVWAISNSHPWAGASPPDGSFYPPQQLAETLARLRELVEHCGRLLRDLEAMCQAQLDEPLLSDLTRASDLLECLGNAPDGADARLLGLPSEVFAGTEQLLGEWRELSASLATDVNALDDAGGERLRSDAQLLEGLVGRYLTLHRRKSRFMSAGYRADRKRLREVCGRKLRFGPAVELLEFARWVAQQQRQRADLEQRIQETANAVVSAEELLLLATQVEWAGRLRSCWDGALPIGLVTLLSSQAGVMRVGARRLGADLASALASLDPLIVWLTELFPNGIRGRLVKDQTLADLFGILGSLEAGANRLSEWLAFRSCAARAASLGLGPFLQECATRKVSGDALPFALERAICTKWVTEVYGEAQVLAEFSSTSHEQVVEAFARLDASLQSVASNVTVARVQERIPSPPPANEAKLLQKEHAKKRGHLPLRRLLPGVPTLLQSVKPCLLMSPLSVAGYLSREAFAFDLVIFDEASQVTPADAIGCVLRGRQLVVLGDSKQLPPTNFFQVVDDDLDEETEVPGAHEAATFESILDMTRGYLPQSQLLWHYRSRDERLISFSNRRFYDGQLITFPSANTAAETGVEFVYIENGVYDRGGTRPNRREAIRVAELVLQHLTDRPERSLGVIALSLQQRDAIDLELRRCRQTRLDLEPLFDEDRHEPFFVKNLEAVQGDERDEVIISLGYGPTEPGGSPTHQFGPINREGGHRRLNVAVTRARMRTTLVSSIRPEQLDGISSMWDGPPALAEYVRYAARNGRFEGEGEELDREPESDFEWAVFDALKSRGFKVDCQIGTSGFRVDLGVRHPHHDARYVLGIECDGVAYHSAKTVRDRDRLRQDVLEGLGWNIHRVWSTEWVRSSEMAVQRIAERVEGLVKAGEFGIRRVATSEEPPIRTPRVEPVTLESPFLADSFASEPAAPADLFPPYVSYVSRGFERLLVESSARDIAEQFERLVAVESPIHVDSAMLQIARLGGQQRVGSRIKRQLSQGLYLTLQDKRIEQRGEFLWSSGQTISQPRSNSGERQRLSAEIPDEELDAGVIAVLRAQGATRLDDLRVGVVRGFGFARMSRDFAERVGEAIARLEATGRCTASEGFVRLPRSQR